MDTSWRAFLRSSPCSGGSSVFSTRKPEPSHFSDQGSTLEPPAGAPQPPDLETTAAAIALLDARYPWLRGAEERFSNGAPRR